MTEPSLGDSFEIIPPANGVPRSAWFRARRLSTWHRPYAAALIVLDYLGVALANLTTISLLGDANSKFRSLHPQFTTLVYVVIPLAWLLVLWGNGAYDRRYLGIGTDEFKRVMRTAVTLTATISLLAFLTKTAEELSRLTVALSMLGSLVYVSTLRFAARRVLSLARRNGHASHRVLLLGSLYEALEVYTAVTRNPAAGMSPIAIHVSDGYPSARHVETPVPVHAGRDVVSLVRELRADTVAVCGSASTEPGELRRLAWQLEGSGVDLVVAPQLTDIAGPRVHIRPVEGLPLLYVEEPTLSGVGWLFKNLLDRFVAALGLLLFSPVMVAVAIGIRAGDKGPVFFRQRRVGREGKIFSVWKFRTMYVDAEERRATLVDQNESDGLFFKIRDDPRVTPFGRFLRASSLDELPQLINVLLGEMSLVGPRPLPAEDGDYLGDVRRRLLVRPGITGLWQVSGRSDLSWDDAVRLDLYYVDNWSLTFDLTIMWKTIGVVLRSKGAY
ncbi:MAG: sugar transferase [Actinobacteria bacterium]|nr:MAG: sugar transferase [Actinomycetota bacterium]